MDSHDFSGQNHEFAVHAPVRMAAFRRLCVSSDREANVVGSFPITRSIIDRLSMAQFITLSDLQLCSVAT
jgi:hypothetical protein